MLHACLSQKIMILRFYQTQGQKYLTPSQFLVMTTKYPWCNQKNKWDYNCSPSSFPYPITTLKSCDRQLQRFLDIPQLTIALPNVSINQLLVNHVLLCGANFINCDRSCVNGGVSICLREFCSVDLGIWPKTMGVSFCLRLKKNPSRSDETGMMLGLARSHTRSPLGTRVGGIKPFYRGAKFIAIGAISLKKVLAVMTLNDSRDGVAFSVFIEKFLCPQLWPGAVVVMDNLPAHKLTSIYSMIESVGARVICLSHCSPDFNPIEMWWSPLKSFLRIFSPKTPEIIDRIVAVALNLMNLNHLRHWFTDCCYCTS